MAGGRRPADGAGLEPSGLAARLVAGGPLRALRVGVERSFTPVEAWERRPGAALAAVPGGAAHRRREPEKTLLHAVVRERLEPFLAAARDVHAGTACCLGEGAPAGA